MDCWHSLIAIDEPWGPLVETSTSICLLNQTQGVCRREEENTNDNSRGSTISSWSEAYKRPKIESTLRTSDSHFYLKFIILLEKNKN